MCLWRIQGRWRITHRKQECHPVVLTNISLACVVLHNICIDKLDELAVDDGINTEALRQEWYEFRTKWNELNNTTRDQLRETLNMVSFEEAHGISSKGALNVRNALKTEFWKELNE